MIAFKSAVAVSGKYAAGKSGLGFRFRALRDTQFYTYCGGRNDLDQSLLSLAASMSALGQKRAFAVQKGMTALLPKADKGRAIGDVR
jgi:hypothetical protein